jgi:hypothetical protein
VKFLENSCYLLDDYTVQSSKMLHSIEMTETIDTHLISAITDTVAILRQPMEIGSDTYLDKVLFYKGKFENIEKRISQLNSDAIIASNQRGEEFEQVLTALKELHKTYLETIDSHRQSIYAVALKTTLDNARAEARQIREIVDDFYNVNKIKADKELQDLFLQL